MTLTLIIISITLVSIIVSIIALKKKWAIDDLKREEEFQRNLAHMKKEYPFGTHVRVIKQIVYDLIIMPGALGTIVDHSATGCCIWFKITATIVKAVWIDEELLKEYITIL